MDRSCALPSRMGVPEQGPYPCGQLAVDCGIHVLFEIVEGRLSLTSRSLRLAEKGPKKTVAEYVQLQTRFGRISEEQLAVLQEFTDRRWKDLVERHQRNA